MLEIASRNPELDAHFGQVEFVFASIPKTKKLCILGDM